jgi:hypothetical protein
MTFDIGSALDTVVAFVEAERAAVDVGREVADGG